MIESGERLLSSHFVQVPDTPTNFDRPSLSRSIELAKALKIPPQFPKDSGYGPIMLITYLELVLILPIKFHPDLSPRFPVSKIGVSPIQPPMSLDPHQMENGASET